MSEVYRKEILGYTTSITLCTDRCTSNRSRSRSRLVDVPICATRFSPPQLPGRTRRPAQFDAAGHCSALLLLQLRASVARVLAKFQRTPGDSVWPCGGLRNPQWPETFPESHTRVDCHRRGESGWHARRDCGLCQSLICIKMKRTLGFHLHPIYCNK